MSENINESNVVSLDEFRKTHPKPSGKLIRDPYCKSRIYQDKGAQIQSQSKLEAKRSSNHKLEAAMAKYGSSTGNVMKTLYKKKESISKED